jgi:hypothetical protein
MNGTLSINVAADVTSTAVSTWYNHAIRRSDNMQRIAGHYR